MSARNARMRTFRAIRAGQSAHVTHVHPLGVRAYVRAVRSTACNSQQLPHKGTENDMHNPDQWTDQARVAIQAAPANLSAEGWDADSPHPLAVDQVATAIAYLTCGPVRALRSIPTRQPSAASSYGLKHQAERWGRSVGLAPYVANGALIAAALHLRIPMRRHRWRGPNCTLAVRSR